MPTPASPKPDSTRRDFLKTSALIAGGAAIATQGDIFPRAHAAGGDLIRVGLIGCGGRGKGAAADCMSVKDNLKIVAVADAFEKSAQNAAADFRKRFGEKADIPPDRVFSGLDAYQKLIDCGVDMVLLATPPGFRPLHYTAAVKAGKHVFMEKPVCVDAAGFRLVMESNKLAEEKGLKVAVGLQRHHDGAYQAGVKAIQDGKLGDITLLRCYWNGSGIWVRPREFWMNEMQFQIHNWYHFLWLCGDHICEQHVHNLDVCNWVMGDHPVEANGMGGCQVRDNSGIGQIYDHHFVEFTFKNGIKMYSQCRHHPGTWGSVSEWVHGTKGVSEVHKAGGPLKSEVGPMQQEHADLVKAIRDGAKYNEGWYGATSSMTAVLGRMASYSGQIVKWDDAIAKGPSTFPEKLAWDASPRDLPDKDFNYPMPVPGVYKPY